MLSTFPKPTSPLTKPEGDVIVLFVRVCEPVVVTKIEVSTIPWIFVVSASWLVSAVEALPAVVEAVESTYAFVEASVLLTGVGTVTVPVNVGEASGALTFNCVWIAELTPYKYPISVSVTFATLA